jgi:hypothetical protein
MMNGLFPNEESAFLRWTQLCETAVQICTEKKIERGNFYPNQHSKDPREKTIGIALSNYRQGLSKKGTTCPYECVDYTIGTFQFGHWLLFYTDEEKILIKWKSRIEAAHQRVLELEFPLDLYYPCQRSPCEKERETSIALNNYQQALRQKGTHKIYESVTTLLQTAMPHWLSMTTHLKIILEKWRKRWELIKYICQQKKCTYDCFYERHFPGHMIEQRIIDSIHAYQTSPVRYPEVDAFVRLCFPQFI